MLRAPLLIPVRVADDDPRILSESIGVLFFRNTGFRVLDSVSVLTSPVIEVVDCFELRQLNVETQC